MRDYCAQPQCCRRSTITRMSTFQEVGGNVKPLFEKWCHELELGKRPRTTSTPDGQGTDIRRDDGFTPLGVLCDIVDPGGWYLALIECAEDEVWSWRWRDRRAGGSAGSCLPRKMTEALGIDDPGVPIPEGAYAGATCALVDELYCLAGLGFDDVAKVIRWRYLGAERPSFAPANEGEIED